MGGSFWGMSGLTMGNQSQDDNGGDEEGGADVRRKDGNEDVGGHLKKEETR